MAVRPCPTLTAVDSLVMLPGSRATGAAWLSQRPSRAGRSELSPRGGDPVGVAVIGVGDWGPKLLRVLAADPEAAVRWIWDLDHDRLAQYRWRYPAARVTTRFERVLADPGVEAVIIATPVHTRYELAIRALGAGRHAFVEEPLLPSNRLVDDLAGMAADDGRILMYGHTFLELRDFIRAVSANAGMGVHTELDRSVLRLVGDVEASVTPRGQEVALVEQEDVANPVAARPDLALV